MSNPAKFRFDKNLSDERFLFADNWKLSTIAQKVLAREAFTIVRNTFLKDTDYAALTASAPVNQKEPLKRLALLNSVPCAKANVLANRK